MNLDQLLSLPIQDIVSGKVDKLRAPAELGFDHARDFPVWFERAAESWWGRRLLRCALRRSLGGTQFRHRRYALAQAHVGRKTREFFKPYFFDFLVNKLLSVWIDESLRSQYSAQLYSFRRGRSSHQMLRDICAVLARHPQGEWHVFKADVAKYDQHIQHHTLRAQLRRRAPLLTSAALDVLTQILRAPVGLGPERAELSFCLWRGLPTGTPLVPVLENLYLMDLDDHLDRALAQGQCDFWGRYGDDVIVLSRDGAALASLAEQSQALLHGLGLHFKTGKTSRVTLGPRGEFEHLGLQVKRCGVTGLPPAKARELRDILGAEIRKLDRYARSLGKDAAARCAFVSEALTQTMECASPALPHLSEFKAHITDVSELREWDLYLKQKILKQVFGRISGQSFRRLPAGFFHRRLYSFVRLARAS